jgi:phosphoglycolate phosphatase
MAYKLVILDLDGTLADTFPWFLSVLNGVADRYRFKRIEKHEVERLRGFSARQIIRHLGVPAWKLPLIARHMRSLSARDIDGLKLFDGIDTMLRSLSKADLVLAVVSSNSEENVRRLLGPGLAELIGHFACGASLFGKAAKLRKVLKASGVSPGEVICIGDEIRDYEAARRVGLAFGAVSWGFTSPEALQALTPEAVFPSPHGIVEVLAPTTGHTECPRSTA